MSAAICNNCGELRKVDIIISSAGWHQPPCYNCGDPGYIEPLSKEKLQSNWLQDIIAKCCIAVSEMDHDLREWRTDLELSNLRNKPVYKFVKTKQAFSLRDLLRED